MTAILIALLYAMMQASPQVPRQPPGNPAGNSNKVQRDTNKNHGKSTSPPIQNTETTDSNKKHSNGEASEKNQEPISVKALPEINVRKDRWDKAYIVFTGLLVLITSLTLATIWYQARETARAARATQTSAEAILRQVDTMERQTKAAETAANAAITNAEAATQNIEMFISKERAKLRVEPKKLSLAPKALSVYTADFTVSIYGPTAAFITKSGCRAITLPLERVGGVDHDPFLIQLHNFPEVVSPNTPPRDQMAIFHLGSNRGDAILEEIRNDRLLVELRGFIKYRDVFDRDRETRFRYVWKFSDLPPLGEERSGNWERCGPDEDNAQT